MSGTRRGTNSPLSAKLRRREDAQKRSQASGIEEDQKAQNPKAAQAQAVTDAEKAALAKNNKPALIELAKRFKLSTKGTKAELIARIVEAQG